MRAQKKDGRTQQEACQLQATERRMRRKHAYRYLNSELSVPKTVKTNFMFKSPSLWQFVMAALAS